MIIALLGMLFLVGSEAGQHLQVNRGDLLAIAASGFYAAYLLATQRARATVDTLTFMAVSVSAGILVLLVVNLLRHAQLTGYSAQTWLALLGLGVISHLSGVLGISYALGHLRAAPVAVSMLAQVVVTAILSMPLLGEGLYTNQIIGGLLVLGGIYFVNQRREQP
jgi:drug/metabolite transporter (DMT)-like permease